MLMSTRSRSGEGGQALVEFAIVIPVFLLILFSIIQIGLVFQAQNALVNAVRETARFAAPYRITDTIAGDGYVIPACTAVSTKLQDALHSQLIGFDSANEVPAITYKWNADDNGDGNSYLTVQVTAAYKFPLYVPLAGTFLDGFDGVTDTKLRLSAQEEMRIENDPLVQTGSNYAC
jgi:Flp pilus assembly protein TadG